MPQTDEALISEQSPSPCEFTVECMGIKFPLLRVASQFLLQVTWTPQTAAKARWRRDTEQPKSIVERAAIALAALLFT